ncbi:MAG: hypothetical protein K2V38_05690 [Gemmataceae bacterium]|nr:hypothetical protein [Gemmataceae bacterium]
MALVKCEVTDGPRQNVKSVGVLSVEGFAEYLAIEERFLVPRGDHLLLPVRIIARDPRQKTALVQLPVEADSGANRVWVSSESLSDIPDEITV